MSFAMFCYILLCFAEGCERFRLQHRTLRKQLV